MTPAQIETPARPAGSHYANRAAARRAVELAAPLIEAGRTDRNIVGSGFLHAVVMDPGLPPGLVTFEDAILVEHSFGDPAQWDADYAAFARAKARASWSAGMDSRRLQQAAPHLLRHGDTLLWGSAWVDGIVVGVSGAFPQYDEVYAATIAHFLRALAWEARQGEPGNRLSLT